jgi:hypothetical protein
LLAFVNRLVHGVAMSDQLAAWGFALGAIGTVTGVAALVIEGRSFGLDKRTRDDPVLELLRLDLLNMKRTMQWWMSSARVADAEAKQHEPRDISDATTIALARLDSTARTLTKKPRQNVLPVILTAHDAYNLATASRLALGLDGWANGKPVSDRQDLHDQLQHFGQLTLTAIDAAVTVVETTRAT